MSHNHNISYAKNQYKINSIDKLTEEPIYEEFNQANLKNVHKYHQSIPTYQETPLVNLKGFANDLGIHQVLVKDESKRFNLNAFKVLGASYSLAKQLVSKTQEDANTTSTGICK